MFHTFVWTPLAFIFLPFHGNAHSCDWIIWGSLLDASFLCVDLIKAGVSFLMLSMYWCTSHLPLANLGWKGAASWQKSFTSMCVILNRALTNPASNSTNSNSTTCLDSLFQGLKSHTFIKLFLDISTAAVSTSKLLDLSGSTVECNFSQSLCKYFYGILYVGLCLFQFGYNFLPELFLTDI